MNSLNFLSANNLFVFSLKNTRNSRNTASRCLKTLLVSTSDNSLGLEGGANGSGSHTTPINITVVREREREMD